MFQTSVLVSGSKGNSVLVRTGDTALLLDAGVAAKTIFAAMDALRVPRESIQGIVVSHEHSDHIRGVGVVARALKIPVFINEDTYCYCSERLGKLPWEPVFFETGQSFQIGDIIVHPFSSSHDAVDSCNFTFRRTEDEERRLGVATDLGYPTNLSIENLKRCTTLVLESNHDLQMLMNGPYEWHLKQRVKSRLGHLSNDQAVGLISNIMHHELDNLVLAHLSEINNHPDLAIGAMRDYLSSLRRDLRLLVASQYEHTPLIDV